MENLTWFLLFALLYLGYGLNQAERKIRELETYIDTINDLENRINEIEDRVGISYGIEDLR